MKNESITLSTEELNNMLRCAELNGYRKAMKALREYEPESDTHAQFFANYLKEVKDEVLK